MPKYQEDDVLQTVRSIWQDMYALAQNPETQAYDTPSATDPTDGKLLRRQVHHIHTIRAVDGNPPPPGHEAHDFIPGNGGAAPGKADRDIRRRYRARTNNFRISPEHRQMFRFLRKKL